MIASDYTLGDRYIHLVEEGQFDLLGFRGKGLPEACVLKLKDFFEVVKP